MEQIFNPYLPLNKYIPDGEPHVFGDRLYVYGSHDRAGGTAYCEDHYEVWSAPVSDLRDWRCEGTSYLRTQDPSNQDDTLQLWAPDVTQGSDGRYYLYYCLSFFPEIGVAVADYPSGPFTFYGHVHYPAEILNGKLLQEGMVFDPAVLTDDDGKVYLYYGFAPACEKEINFPRFSEEELLGIPEKDRKKLRAMSQLVLGEYAMVVELEQDMITCKGKPKPLIPGGNHTAGTGFEGHGFFEAASIRKIHEKYYFVYSSHKSHELCYAISDRPDSGFQYGGTIISNGDIGLRGRTDPVYPLGNNHGGLVQIGNDYYIFYHRHTNATEFSRQGCAEKIRIEADGSIPQVEITSCGLNGGPLPASGIYPAVIACHLTDSSVQNIIDYQRSELKQQICITEKQNQSYITNIKDGSVIGFKYFQFQKPDTLILELRGQFKGTIHISFDAERKETAGLYEISESLEYWQIADIRIKECTGIHALYISVFGEGKLELKTISFKKGQQTVV